MNNKDEIIKKLQIKNGKLQIQIERLKLDKEEYYLDYLNLQQRIDKAIEYIHNHQIVFELSDRKGIQKWFDEFYKDLLNILRGKDNED